MVGTVVKILGGIYTVMYEGKMYTCSVRTTAKKVRIVVGDYVELVPNTFHPGNYIITNVQTRKNTIPRPVLANIDKLLIVVAPKPEPDLLLVDKLIVYCMLNAIEPVIVVNKSDIASKTFISSIQKQYEFLKVLILSANEKNGIKELTEYIGGSFCALCGQSAVGKSSLLNSIIPDINLETQGLSRKVDRGKHTTRANELYLHDNLMIADTPGFSSLELKIEHKELASFYPEFDGFLGECKYLDCSHVKEGKDCKIIAAVERGEINKDRYTRYCELYTKLREAWEKKYD